MGAAASCTGDMSAVMEQAKAAANEAKNKAEGLAEKAANEIKQAALAALHSLDDIADYGDTDRADAPDILTAFKALALCKLSYVTSQDNPERKELEEKWLQALGVTEYTIWHPKEAVEQGKGGNSDAGAFFTQMGQKALAKVQELTKSKNTGGGVAISGMIPNLSATQTAPVPFICWRGTASPQDMLSDLESLVPEKFTTRKGNEVGRTGLGFFNHYNAIRDMTVNDEHILEKAVKAASVNPDGGILIAGHSLGAAAAQLCAAELFTDYKDKFKITTVTFGSPRVWDSATAEKIDTFIGLKHLRFMNTGDMITVLGNVAVVPLHHTGIPLVFPPQAQAPKHEEDSGIPERPLDWHIVPNTHSRDYGLQPKSMVTAMERFALTFAGSHSVSGGPKGDGSAYMDKFLQAPSFQEALNSIDDINIKKSFDLKDLFNAVTPKPPKEVPVQ